VLECYCCCHHQITCRQLLPSTLCDGTMLVYTKLQGGCIQFVSSILVTMTTPSEARGPYHHQAEYYDDCPPTTDCSLNAWLPQ